MKRASVQRSWFVRSFFSKPVSYGVLIGSFMCARIGGMPVAQAGEIGHYNPGVLNIRDFAMPEPGVYGSVYNYWYWTDRLNDKNGNTVSSVKVGPGQGVTLGVNVDVNVYAIAPTVIWISDWKVLGAKYGAYIAPSFANSSVGASLSRTTGTGRSVQGSQFDVGDLFVQPLWLGWTKKHWDFAFGYGFYAPVGRYNIETVTLPQLGSVKAEAIDNIGLGFWTHQFQGAATWYVDEHHATAVCAALTYEINQKKKDFDLTPGNVMTLNWGVSQYLPLNKDNKVLLEVGLTGYNSWQLTDDAGSDAVNPGVHDQVHAVGGQLGLAYVPLNAAVKFHYLHEYSADDRFLGDVIGASAVIKF